MLSGRISNSATGTFRLHKLVHKIKEELDPMRDNAGLPPLDVSDVSEDSADERHMKKFKTGNGRQPEGQSEDPDSDDDVGDE